MRQPRYLTTGALALGAIVRISLRISLAIPVASACGPIEYINQVSVKAASAVAAAKMAQADRYAPYEYTAAEEYLHKAREEAGYAEYQWSIDYGRRAEALANRARAIAITRLSQPTASSAVQPSGAQPSGAEPTPPLRPGDSPPKHPVDE